MAAGCEPGACAREPPAGVALHRAGFSSPQNVSFKYILKAFDTDWTDASQQRAAYYCKPIPGTLPLPMAARNRDGVWSETSSPLELACSAHYYQTLWFTSGGQPVFSLGFVAYQLRVRQVTAALDSQFQNDFQSERASPRICTHAFAGFLSASMQLHVANDQLPADSPAKALVSRVLELMRHVIEEGRNALRGLHSLAGH